MCSSDVLRVQCEPPVSVAESFEDRRGLRGTVAGWRRMCVTPPCPPQVREHSGGKTSALRGVIYHDHLEEPLVFSSVSTELTQHRMCDLRCLFFSLSPNKLTTSILLYSG